VSFAFGDKQWPGLAKLNEECGEVIQVIGKLMMTHGNRAHWSGDLRPMLIEELADLEAAITFFNVHNFELDERAAFTRRLRAKMDKFEEWHDDMDADPPPALAASQGPTGNERD
jgi:NTP pyrophosphatase (non-canonical NTP hydrolase)